MSDLPTRRNRRCASPQRASFNLVTPPDAPRSGRQFLRLAMPVQVLRTFPATARCALVSPASLLGAVCSHASHACAAGRHLLRLSMCARRFAPTPTLRSAYVFLYRSFVISFLRMTSLRWVSPIHGAVCSHVSRRAAAGRYSLRLSMCARHYVPNAHASLREIPPCVAARRCASPPQNASFLPPPAAVTVLPQNDNSPPSVPGPGHL